MERARLRLIEWRLMSRNSLRGFATVELPSGLHFDPPQPWQGLGVAAGSAPAQFGRGGKARRRRQDHLFAHPEMARPGLAGRFQCRRGPSRRGPARTPDMIRGYLALGWELKPIPAGEKGPRVKGWPDLKTNADDIEHSPRGRRKCRGAARADIEGFRRCRSR